MRRFQHMDDVKIALDELKEESQSGVWARKPRRRYLKPLPAAGVVLLLAAAGALVSWWRMRAPDQGPVLTRLTSDTGLTTTPAISRDGKLLAYASDRSGEGNTDIWVRQIGSEETRSGRDLRLTHDPADDSAPSFFSRFDQNRVSLRARRRRYLRCLKFRG